MIVVVVVVGMSVNQPNSLINVLEKQVSLAVRPKSILM